MFVFKDLFKVLIRPYLIIIKNILNNTKVLYEYRDIWAEESGVLSTNSAEWSFGNGSTGYIGIPLEAGWELVSMYFTADTFPSNSSVSIGLMNYGNTPSGAIGNQIYTFVLLDARDGGGNTNNAYKIVSLPVPIILPTAGTTLLGFITRSVVGTVRDARVGVRLRRPIGRYISGI